MFAVVSFDCDYVLLNDFQKSQKLLENLHGFWGRHLGIRNVCMEFLLPLTVRGFCLLCNEMKPTLGKVTNF